jgi:hypothetical protein
VADVQRLIDEMRFQLDAEVFELAPAMKQLAADYADVCRLVNMRLRRCEDFLKQGLRAEAIHTADADPNLLDLVATVDIPERSRWDGMVRLFGLPRAEPLLIDVAEQLNAAYPLQYPLEKLLEQHRLLALTRAPIIDRLKVLRELAVLDEDSPVWNDDARVFELARISEIEAAAAEAEAQGDFAKLERLVDELTDGNWRETPPACVVEQVRQLAQRVTRRTAPSDPAGLREALNAAATTGDMARCRALRRRWHELGILSPPVGRNGHTDARGPGVAWLAREDARDARDVRIRRAALALEYELEADADIDELREAAERLREIAGEIPEALASRVHDRIAKLENDVRSRDRLFIYSAVACGLIAVSIGLVVMFWK